MGGGLRVCRFPVSGLLTIYAALFVFRRMKRAESHNTGGPTMEQQSDINYTITHLINDPSLSWKAKGLYVHLLTRPKEWLFSTEELVSSGKDGRTSTRSGIKELEKAGYIRLDRQRSENGQVTGIELTFLAKSLNAGGAE